MPNGLGERFMTGNRRAAFKALLLCSTLAFPNGALAQITDPPSEAPEVTTADEIDYAAGVLAGLYQRVAA